MSHFGSGYPSHLLIKRLPYKDNYDLVSVNLNKVTAIEEKAFENCTKLKKVIIPANVETISPTAFVGCDEVVLYGNKGSAAQTFAGNDFEFVVLKPYIVSSEKSFEKDIVVGEKDTVDLNSIFAVDYDSTLKYQVKEGESDYVDIDGNTYDFEAGEAGEKTLKFRAVDSFGEPSEDIFTAKYNVGGSSAPVLNPEKEEIRKIALFGDTVEIDMSDVFTGADPDSLTYKYIDPDEVTADLGIERDQIDWNAEETSWYMGELTAADGKITCPGTMTEYLSYLGKDHEYWVKAYDENGQASEGYLKLIFETHSVDVVVSKGSGVESLDGITFAFKREGAEDITNPAKVDDNNYYFDLEYETRQTGLGPKYQNGYEYSYEISLEGCEPVTGTRTVLSGRSADADNIIEATLTKAGGSSAPVLNPEKEEIRKIALFGDTVEIDMSDVFTGADPDSLTYKYIDPDEVTADLGIERDQIDWNAEETSWYMGELTAADGKITCPGTMTEYLSYLGKDHEYWVKAYDENGQASEGYLKLIFETHSVDVVVSKGSGVESLDGITFAFKREGAEDITNPAKVDDNNYYFDLEYETRQTGLGPKYQNGYEYSYEISLEGCEPVTGTRTVLSGRSADADNIIEATLTKKIDKDVATVINLIDNLGDITLDSEEAVNAAQAAYDALYDDLKPQVTNYNKLLEAKLELANLKLKAAEDELEQTKKDKATTEQELNEAKNNLQEAEKEKQKAEQELQDLKDEIATKALKVSGLKVTSKAKKFTVKWKKNSKAEGYQVQYKLKSAKTFKNLKKTTTKISVKSKKLKKGKKYQFRVRPYKTINGNKIYGKWVSKTVKCK